jgi:hypothetical protein
MWDAIYELLFCPQDSIIYGSQNGIIIRFWYLIPLACTGALAYGKRAIDFCRRKRVTK